MTDRAGEERPPSRIDAVAETVALVGGALLIASSHGLQFRVADPKTLDRPSRKLLERFL